MKKYIKIFLLVVLAGMFFLVGCGPFYTKTSKNEDYWGFANARGQAQALALEKIAALQKEKPGTRPPAELNMPGVIMNKNKKDKILTLRGPGFVNFEKTFLLTAGEEITTQMLAENQVYLYTVRETDGSIYRGAELNPLPVNNSRHEIIVKGQKFEVYWWINIQ